MLSFTLSDVYLKINPQVCCRDNRLQIKINKWCHEGRKLYFDTACKIIYPLMGLHEFSRSFYICWEILTHNKLSFSNQLWVFHMSLNGFAAAVQKKNPGLVEIISPQKAHFVTSRDKILDEQELWEDTQIMLNMLADDGGLFLQLGQIHTHSVQVLLWIFFQLFREVKLTKPKASYSFSVDKYLLATGFNSKMYQGFQTLALHQYTDECPVSWFGYIASVENKFIQAREEQQQHAVVVTDIILAKKPFITSTELCELATTCHSGEQVRLYRKRYLESQQLHGAGSRQ